MNGVARLYVFALTLILLVLHSNSSAQDLPHTVQLGQAKERGSIPVNLKALEQRLNLFWRGQVMDALTERYQIFDERFAKAMELPRTRRLGVLYLGYVLGQEAPGRFATFKRWALPCDLCSLVLAAIGDRPSEAEDAALNNFLVLHRYVRYFPQFAEPFVIRGTMVGTDEMDEALWAVGLFPDDLWERDTDFGSCPRDKKSTNAKIPVLYAVYCAEESMKWRLN